MKKAIIVKKNQNHIYGLRFLAVFFLASVGVAMALWGYFALLCLPAVLPVLVMLLYYETWQISFSSNAISKRIFFRNSGTYSYAQLSDVVMLYSSKEHEYIRMIFKDGKKWSFRLEDQNANQAVSRITSHRSIHNRVRYDG